MHGGVYGVANQPAAALPFFDRALALQPNHVKALLRRAQAREELEKMQEALDDMKKVVEIDPKNREALDVANSFRPPAA